MSIEEDAPKPPSGYRVYQPDFRIQGRWIRILGAGYVGVVGVILVVIWLLWQHLPPSETGKAVVMTLGGTVFLYIIHELSHFVVGKAIGGRVTLDFFEMPDKGRVPRLRPVVHTFETYRTRGESVFLYVVPLLVITPICLAVAVVSTDLGVVLAALVVLGVNIAGSAQDFRNVLETFRLPPGVLEVHLSRDEEYYFIPESNEGVSESRS